MYSSCLTRLLQLDYNMAAVYIPKATDITARKLMITMPIFTTEKRIEKQEIMYTITVV